LQHHQTSPERTAAFAYAYLESYGRWREESAGVRAAYSLLQAAIPPTRRLAFAAYRAALDREEAAANEHRDVVVRIWAYGHIQENRKEVGRPIG